MATADIIHGNTGKLLLQYQTAGLLTVPTPAAPIGVYFEEATINRAPVRSANNTLTQNAVGKKRTEDDEEPTGTITARFCLNGIGHFLKLLCGNPVTTGTDPYTHVFTFSDAARPTALMELVLGNFSGSVNKYRRLLGAHLNQMSWDPMAREQKWQGQLMFAQEVLPRPSAAFGAATYPSQILAVTHRASIDDPDTAGALGDITSCNVDLNLNTRGYPLANGQRGYGAFIVGDEQLPALGGTLAALFANNTLWDKAASNSTNALEIVQGDASGTYSLTSLFPAISFDTEPEWTATLAGGSRVISTNWYAHDGGAAPTFTLVNSVASY